MKLSTRDITVLATALALMFALTPIPFVSLFLVPVLFIGCTQKWYMGAIAGLIFGLVSLMYAFIMPVTPVAIAFQHAPWIPIVPRIFVGLFTSLSFWGFRKIFKSTSRFSRMLPYNLATTIGTLTNTVLVLTSLILLELYTPLFPDGLIIPALGTIYISIAIELVVANIIAAPLSAVVGRALRIGEFNPSNQLIFKSPITNNDSKPQSDDSNL